MAGLFSKFDIVQAHGCQTADFDLFNFTSEYRDFFRFRLIQDDRKGGNHGVVSQVGDAVHLAD